MRERNVALLLAASDSAQSVGFVLGPLLGAAAQGLSFLEPMLLCLSLCSAALAPALWGLDSSLAATPS